MRIFLSCQQSLTNHPVPAYQFWEFYFKKGIEEAGYDWLEANEVDWAEGLVYHQNREQLQKWLDCTWTKTIVEIKKKHQEKPIDLFLSYLFPHQIDPNAIEEIKKLGIPCVNFFCDNVRQFINVPKQFYCFDLHWVPECKALPMYKKASLNYIHAPMPVWVAPEHRQWKHQENYGVSFIGSRDIQRERLFAEVINLGIDNLEIRGAGWLKNLSFESESSPEVSFSPNFRNTINNQIQQIKNYGMRAWLRKLEAKRIPKIADEIFMPYVRDKPDFNQYIKITQESQITLGVNRYPSFRHPQNHPDTYSRMRDIEAPMLGACYLTEWTEGLDLLYDLGEEIETYKSAEEMVEKIKELSGNSHKRCQMREQAQIKTLEKLSIISSLQKILENFNL